MSEPISEEPKANVFTRFEAAAFNMQYASYVNHGMAYVRSLNEYADQRKLAEKMRVDKRKLDLAELRGKLRAAMEFGSEEDTKAYKELIETREQDKT